MDPKDCCDPHLNSTCPRILPCCRAMIESNRRFYRKGVNDSHDIRLIHSTIYTIIGNYFCYVEYWFCSLFILPYAKLTLFIFSFKFFSGCAVAFMFILVLVGLAICRFHIKRRWSFRYYTNSASNESEGSLPSGSRIISSINIRQGRRCQRTRRSRQHLGMFISKFNFFL